jgi:hypothetical protein
MATRLDVLSTSLILENMTSHFLSKLVGVDGDPETTYSFGNKGSALSFSQKIHLLIDIGALDKEIKNKFFTFMEIRNQFMHNALAKSYELCFSYLKEKKSFVMGLYKPEKEISVEEHLRLAVEELSNQILTIAGQLIEKVREKIRSETETKLINRMFSLLGETMQEEKGKLTTEFNNQVEKTYTSKEVVNIVTKFYEGSKVLTLKKIQREIEEKKI